MERYKPHAIDQSSLYRLTSKRRLATLLKMPLNDLLFLASLKDTNYQSWPLTQKRRDVLAGIPAKDARYIQQPMPLLRAVHDQLALIFSRIEKPPFVYSATKGRSYLDNALQHKNEHAAFKVDIKSFYPSVKLKWVKRFFERDLKCESDVAHFLATLCCVGGMLPTGSPISPVLSYFACAPVFLRMAEIAKQNELVFTLYVDDMVFSGAKASRVISTAVLRELAANGFKGHKVAHFRPGQIRVITGVAVGPAGISIPYKRQKRIRIFEEAFARTKLPDDVALLGRTLLGQYREGERLQRGSRERAKPIQERLDAIHAARFADLTAVAPARRKPTPRPKLNRDWTQKKIAQLREKQAKAVQPVLATVIGES